MGEEAAIFAKSFFEYEIAYIFFIILNSVTTMAKKPRIPRLIDNFSQYISVTGNYLSEGTPTNASRLGITEPEVAIWQGFVTIWTPLYTKYSDKKNSRTTAVKDQLYEVIGSCVAFDQSNHILDRIASSTAVTITDLETFHIKSGPLEKTTHSIPVTPVSELVSPTIQPLGGGLVSVKCYTSTSQRAGICAGADSVQYLYAVGTTPPASAETEGLKAEISTRASFNLDAGSASSGKYLYIYLRWYNAKHPHLAGPWSSMNTTLIL